MYYRILFRARPGDVYFFELKKDKPQVLDVIHRVKEQFKIIHSTIKVFDGKVELFSQELVYSERTYIVRRFFFIYTFFSRQNMAPGSAEEFSQIRGYLDNYKHNFNKIYYKISTQIYKYQYLYELKQLINQKKNRIKR